MSIWLNRFPGRRRARGDHLPRAIAIKSLGRLIDRLEDRTLFSTPTADIDVLGLAAGQTTVTIWPGQAVHARVSDATVGDPLTGAGNTLGGGLPHTASYRWDFGDTSSTSAYNVLPGFNAAHVYDTPGNYTLTLRVTNENGEQSAAVTRSVVVRSEHGAQRADLGLG
jgi:hypothetical protein